MRLCGFADFFCFYELCEFLFVGICATPLGSGEWEGILMSAGSFASLRNTAVKYGSPSSRTCGVWE